ncbi:T9SS type A sorting domain-containing protein [Hymenobacter edaphi]|uniref:Secretion system C-terminal sorting domain-containing protein n=1 Tax=Hymenobacter edaphi TaxID=2211146 RepID=A0A328BRF7_9BACT|nr:T9SS type A sorting domain-containing protein [Hymenobacter edaphi]RAK69677.1 hypothetical protein DLM85_02120 [Hymenobacter edaphi]
MKKTLLTLATLGLVTLAAQAQWVNQPITFANSTMGVVQLDAVNATTAWGLAIDPFTGDYELARTTNGTTWTAGAGTSLGTSQFVTFVSALDANTAWVSTISQAGGKILKTTDGGATWTTQTTATQFGGADSYPNFVYFFNATEGVALGDPDGATPGMEIYTTTNGGTTWTRATNIPAALGTELGALNPSGMTTPPAVFGNSIWFPTTEGRVYYSTNKGLTWSVSDTGLNDEISAISFASATAGLAVVSTSGGAQQVKRTTDGGVTWTTVTYTGTLRGLALDNIPGKTGYVSAGTSLFGQAGSSYSFDNGATWTNLETTTEHISLDLVSATEGWTGGINPTTFSGTGVNKLSSSVLGNRRDAVLQQALSVYPNPSHDGVFTLNLATSLPQATALRVTDALGREVYRTSLNATSVRASSAMLDLRQHKAGLYTLELRSDKGVAQQKLVIQ